MGRSWISKALFSAPLALSIVAPRAAWAEPTDAERMAAAQALFDDARALTERGEYAAACPKFAESRRLDPTMGTTFYLAECLEHIGRLASAWSYYIEVADAARASGQADREAYARNRAEALRPRLPWLVVVVSPAARTLPGLQVKRDGIVLGEAQLGVAIPVDLGDHVITAAAPGRQPWEARISVSEEAKTTKVEIPVLDALSPVAPPIIDRGPSHTIEVSSGMSAQRVVGVAAGAAGVIGLGLGAFFGLRAMSKQDESNKDGHCDAADTCDTVGLGLRDEAITAATVSTIGFIAGGVALAGGVTLFFTAPEDPPPQAKAAREAADERASALVRRPAPSVTRTRVTLGLGSISVLTEF